MCENAISALKFVRNWRFLPVDAFQDLRGDVCCQDCASGTAPNRGHYLNAKAFLNLRTIFIQYLNVLVGVNRTLISKIVELFSEPFPLLYALVEILGKSTIQGAYTRRSSLAASQSPSNLFVVLRERLIKRVQHDSHRTILWV